MTAKKFASQGDLQEKKTSFIRLSDNAYAYTAEGDPNSGVIIGDDAVMVIVQAMKKADSTDASEILKAIPQTKYEGLTGNIAFDAKGDLKESVITLNQYKSGKIQTLDVVKMK